MPARLSAEESPTLLRHSACGYWVGPGRSLSAAARPELRIAAASPARQTEAVRPAASTGARAGGAPRHRGTTAVASLLATRLMYIIYRRRLL